MSTRFKYTVCKTYDVYCTSKLRSFPRFYVTKLLQVLAVLVNQYKTSIVSSITACIVPLFFVDLIVCLQNDSPQIVSSPSCFEMLIIIPLGFSFFHVLQYFTEITSAWFDLAVIQTRYTDWPLFSYHAAMHA
jgi:hypothetical protein